LATGFINSFMFGTYGMVKQELQKNSKEVLTIPQIMFAGSFTGVFMSIIVTPMEGIKAQLQVQYAGEQRLYSGPIDCAQKLYRSGGLPRLYRGCLATCFIEVRIGLTLEPMKQFEDISQRTPIVKHSLLLLLLLLERWRELHFGAVVIRWMS